MPALDLSRAAELVALICHYAHERSCNLTTVQIVKYLYLVDLHHARKSGGETVTGWPWAFIHFGPYCSESMTAIDSAVERGLVERLTYESRNGDKDYHRYKPLVVDEPKIADEIPYLVLSKLKQAIKRFGDDTGRLLDHVYFETEPMYRICPFDRLDFTRSRAAEPIAVYSLDRMAEKKRRKGREILAALRQRTLEAAQQTPIDTGPHDEPYFEAIAHDDAHDLDGEHNVVAGFGDLRPPDDSE